MKSAVKHNNETFQDVCPLKGSKGVWVYLYFRQKRNTFNYDLFNTKFCPLSFQNGIITCKNTKLFLRDPGQHCRWSVCG